MTSSVTTDCHGVRVVTQVIPLLSPEPAQCPTEYKDHKLKEPEAPYMTRMFLKGEPVALGTVQIFIGIVMIALGAVTWFIQTLYGTIPLGLGLCFILSGSVTLGAHKGTSPLLIKSAIALNIISALMAVSGVSFFCFALAIKSNLSACETVQLGYYNNYYDCQSITESLKRLLYGTKGIQLVLSVLEVCVCVTTVVFSCKANQEASGRKMEVVMVQGAGGSQDALLNRDVDSPTVYEP